jgi:hypothetical protein
MSDRVKGQFARVCEISNKMGVSDEELGQRLAGGMGTVKTEDAGCVDTPNRSHRISIYEKSILLSVLIGLGYVSDQIIRFGSMHAMGTIGYVAFCVFMISSKRLLEKHVGTYIIGTGIHLPPSRRPAWGGSIILGWVLLSLPALLIVLKRISKQ